MRWCCAGLPPRTQWTYVTAVKQLARYHDCSPALLSGEQIQAVPASPALGASPLALDRQHELVRHPVSDLRRARPEPAPCQDSARADPAAPARVALAHRGGGLGLADLPPVDVPIKSRKSGVKVNRLNRGLMGIELHRQRAGDAARRSEAAACVPGCCGA